MRRLLYQLPLLASVVLVGSGAGGGGAVHIVIAAATIITILIIISFLMSSFCSTAATAPAPGLKERLQRYGSKSSGFWLHKPLQVHCFKQKVSRTQRI